MAGPDGHPGERALSKGTGGVSRAALQWGGIGIAILAFVALDHVAMRSRDAIHFAADAQAASDAAGYLTTIAPPRRSSSRPDARFLSVASVLKNSAWWTGELQVWLDGTPLLPFDSTGAAAPSVPLPGLEGVPRGSVTAWHTVPRQVSGWPGLWAGLVLIMLIPLAGRFLPRPAARVVATVSMLVVWGLAVGHLLLVATTERAATDSRLLRSRRMLEITALGRRLSEPAIASMSSGLTVLAVDESTAVRYRVVTRDSLGVSIVATGARRQAWRLIAPPERLVGSAVLLLTLVSIVVISTGAVRALGAREDYLSMSPRTL